MSLPKNRFNKLPKKTVPGKHSKVSVRIRSKNDSPFALENWNLLVESKVRKNRPLEPIIKKIHAKLGNPQRWSESAFVNVARSYGLTPTEALKAWNALKKAQGK